ncbi:hypothetical protein Prudu_011363 [Prunus dulcis]|uniref:Berberine/berberine-like domain-containing protein n=1 Tax=Prunus dulcis TaxID=3755 RepID=A0A4Y1RAF4_PRUDU|nr:hypothetical protein Prudu_011363 [Prunus dulcis]
MVDNIEDAKVVDVDGIILDRKSMEKIVFGPLEEAIKLVAVPAKVTVFNVKRTLEQGATDIIYKWQFVAPKLPQDIFIRAMPQVKNNTEGNKTVEVSFIGHFLGQSEPISKQGIESIWQILLGIEKVWMQWNPYGGRMSEISESETPFPHRAGNIFAIQYWLFWVEQGADTTNKYIDLSRKLYEGMTPFVSKSPREAFQNYRDLDIGANLDNQTRFETAKVYGSKYFKGMNKASHLFRRKESDKKAQYAYDI